MATNLPLAGMPGTVPILSFESAPQEFTFIGSQILIYRKNLHFTWEEGHAYEIEITDYH